MKELDVKITHRRHFMVDWGFPAVLLFFAWPIPLILYTSVTDFEFSSGQFAIIFFIILLTVLIFFLSKQWLQFYIDPINGILFLPGTKKILFSDISFVAIDKFDKLLAHAQKTNGDPMEHQIFLALIEYRNKLENAAKGFYTSGGYVTARSQTNMSLSGVHICVVTKIGEVFVRNLTFTWVLPSEYVRIINTLNATGIQTSTSIEGSIRSR